MLSTLEGTIFAREDTAETRYPVNIRITIPFLPRPFFVTFIVGPERRGVERRRIERRRHPLNTWGNLATIVTASSALIVTTLFASLIVAAL